MKKTIKWLLLILALALSGLAAYLFANPKKALQVVIPDLNKVEHIQVNFMQDTARINARLDIENKGIFKLDIDSLEYRVRLDTATLLSAQRYIGIKLASSQKDTIDLLVSLPYKRLRREIKGKQGQDSVNVSVDLKLVYSTLFGRAVLHYPKTMRIEVPRPPEFEIEKVDYLHREKKNGYFMVHLRMHNHGKLRLNVSGLRYSFEAPELFSAHGMLKKEVQIEPLSRISVPLPVKVEFKNIIKLLGRFVGKRETDYSLKVTGLVRAKPGEKQVPVEMERRGRVELR